MSEALVAVVYFGVGFGAGMLSLALWQHRHGQVELSRVLSVAILAVVAGASVLGVWNSHQLREQAECQSRVNAGFLESLTQNSELNERERDNLDTTVERLVDEEDAPDVVLSDYLAERDRIEQERAEYPSQPQEVCE